MQAARAENRSDADVLGFPARHHFGPATVLEPDPVAKGVWLALTERPGQRVWARIALAESSELRPGDTVLATGGGPDLYVIGVLERAGDATAEPRSIPLANGASLAVQPEGDVELLTRDGTLLLRFDPRAGRTRVHVESGDLEFVTDDGDISFDSARDVRFRGRNVEFAAREHMNLGVVDALGRLTSAISMASRRLVLRSAALELAAGRTDLQSDELRCTARRFRAKIAISKLTLGTLHTVAERVVSRANDVFSTVSNLSQLRAGRIRTLVATSFHLKSRNVNIKSDEDFKVQGRKIHLG